MGPRRTRNKGADNIHTLIGQHVVSDEGTAMCMSCCGTAENLWNTIMVIFSLVICYFYVGQPQTDQNTGLRPKGKGAFLCAVLPSILSLLYYYRYTTDCSRRCGSYITGWDSHLNDGEARDHNNCFSSHLFRSCCQGHHLIR